MLNRVSVSVCLTISTTLEYLRLKKIFKIAVLDFNEINDTPSNLFELNDVGFGR